jgi:hypothetical protein
MGGILRKRDRIADLVRNRADAGFDPKRPQVGNEVGVEVRDRTCSERDSAGIAADRLEHNLVIGVVVSPRALR